MVSIRSAIESDRNFIFKSWLNSNFDGSPARYLDRSVYYKHHWQLITRLYPKATSLIVHDKKDPDHILGFCVFRSIDGDLVVDYIYVKAAFREMGIGTFLFSTAKHLAHKDQDRPWVYTHRTDSIKSSADLVGAIFNPYLLYGVFGEGEKFESDADASSRNVSRRDILS